MRIDNISLLLQALSLEILFRDYKRLNITEEEFIVLIYTFVDLIKEA